MANIPGPGGLNESFAESDAKAAEISKQYQDIINNADPTVTGQIPFFSTGARALIRIGGRPIGVCKNFNYKVSYNATPINTIDTNIPWDIDVGQLRVAASLERIINPLSSPEAEALMAIMPASVHQPMVEIQVLDAVGSSLFFAKGMFTEVDGSIGVDRISTYTAKFIGTAYQHYVRQFFKPYTGVAAAAGNLLNGLQNVSKNFPGP